MNRLRHSQLPRIPSAEEQRERFWRVLQPFDDVEFPFDLPLSYPLGYFCLSDVVLRCIVKANGKIVMVSRRRDDERVCTNMESKATYTTKPSIFARMAIRVKYDVRPFGFGVSCWRSEDETLGQSRWMRLFGLTHYMPKLHLSRQLL
jgi:hypothetical protein